MHKQLCVLLATLRQAQHVASGGPLANNHCMRWRHLPRLPFRGDGFYCQGGASSVAACGSNSAGGHGWMRGSQHKITSSSQPLLSWPPWRLPSPPPAPAAAPLLEPVSAARIRRREAKGSLLSAQGADVNIMPAGRGRAALSRTQRCAPSTARGRAHLCQLLGAAPPLLGLLRRARRLGRIPRVLRRVLLAPPRLGRLCACGAGKLFPAAAMGTGRAGAAQQGPALFQRLSVRPRWLAGALNLLAKADAAQP